MNAFLWILLIFISVYYGFRIFVRYLLPWLLARFIKNQQEKFNNYSKTQPENDHVSVKTRKTKARKDDTTFGEYVDFEDVDDTINT